MDFAEDLKDPLEEDFGSDEKAPSSSLFAESSSSSPSLAAVSDTVEKESSSTSGGDSGQSTPRTRTRRLRTLAERKCMEQVEVKLTDLKLLPPMSHPGSSSPQQSHHSDQSSDEPLVPIQKLTVTPRSNGYTRKSKSDAAADEVKKCLKSFQHISVNQREKKSSAQKNKQQDMECDCTVSSKGEKGCGDDCLNRLLMIECGKLCSLADNCSNKRFQKKEYAKVEVFKTTDGKGFGLRAREEIPAADVFIMEYVGEMLNNQQFKKRAKQFSREDVKHFYFMALSSEFCIDASMRGNISRFINHSCDPNAETQKWTVDGDLRIGFFSKKRISAGEEITFDYKYERYGQEAQKCLCGSNKCRGWLGGEPGEDDDEEEDDEEDDDDYWSSDSEDEGSRTNSVEEEAAGTG